ncbi:MAG: SUKH-4 family immunity protein [Nostoc sp. NOS(2021)]|uniref:SUKH-4 family immunity protein n=1 Tax=Nostoc sp. NOS(2021) TaxID=2815407 RepID=UPI0025E41940|nr:SUKH-4 family immunity protein [Nostoc sp. NOS(2021)]MBN3896893.1 SUKH-4 family immunity protein [Nostoc sp. NOS(2021)]
MILEDEIVEVFGKKNLVYANAERVHNISLPNETREFILKIGFPHIVDHFRFSMDFEPIYEDIQIDESARRHLGQLHTIGYESASQVIGRMIFLSEIGLDNNASLSDIGRKVRILGVDEYFLFNSEVALSSRICLNLENKGEIVSINPSNLSIIFFDSSIQQLAASIVAYGKNLLLVKNFEEEIEDFKQELKRIDPKALDSEENVWVDTLERLIRDDEGY